jgi:hypothetical protein
MIFRLIIALYLALSGPLSMAAMTIEIVGGAANMIPVTVLAFDGRRAGGRRPRRGDIERPGPQRLFQDGGDPGRGFSGVSPVAFISPPGRGAAPMPW